MIETAPQLEPLLARPAQSVPARRGGGTGSGKTTVAKSILESVGQGRISFIQQDSYYSDVNWRSESELLHHNFDHPSAIDNDLMVAHLAALKAGHAVEVPVYDFVRHRRTARTRRVEPQPVILVEGILIFVEASLRDLLDFKDLRRHRRRHPLHPPARPRHERARADGAGRHAPVPGDGAPDASRIRRAVEALGRHHHP